ncbi:hypothetical protein FRC02_011374 [Tulasnella sp. 418]|nr:hypothetical protein FRC02_011374 [Tulasnella sp. 418]
MSTSSKILLALRRNMSSANATHNARVIAGHKATLKNPRVSEEAKEHSRQMIKELEGNNSTPIDNEHLHRVLGGYRATLHNPNTSESAKAHAEEMITALEATEGYNPPARKRSFDDGLDEHEHRRLGGFKATISNPKTSEAAKDHARQVLAEHDKTS